MDYEGERRGIITPDVNYSTLIHNDVQNGSNLTPCGVKLGLHYKICLKMRETIQEKSQLTCNDNYLISNRLQTTINQVRKANNIKGINQPNV